MYAEDWVPPGIGRGRVMKAVLEGARYILGRQNHEGFWEDFDLPPGRSDMWVTAYVGLKVKSSLELIEASCAKGPAVHDESAQGGRPGGILLDDIQDSLLRAASWLDSHRSAGGGWGYNGSCPQDADSTSHSLLFLHRMGFDVPRRLYQTLAPFIRADGGVSTYHSGGSRDFWSSSHPDVTAAAGLALLELFPERKAEISGVIRYIKKNIRADGMWSSYWWNTPLYATACCLDLALKSGADMDLAPLRDALSEYRSVVPFETALELHCRKRLSLPFGSLEERLVAAQRDDGSWEPAPILRLSYSSMADPWNARDGGKLFADSESLFTTVTVLGSIAELPDPHMI